MPSSDIYNKINKETQQLLSQLATDCVLSTNKIEKCNDDVHDETPLDIDSDVETITQNPVATHSDA